jgi:hypothetical protein
MVMKIRHVEAVFLGYYNPFFFLSRKAAKKDKKRLCAFAALRERDVSFPIWGMRALVRPSALSLDIDFQGLLGVD